MKMKLVKVVDHGTLESERVELSVLEDCRLDHYQIVDTTYNTKGVSNQWRHMHWFYNQSLIEGDEVFLYTKKGVDKIEKINQKNKRYIRYWGLGNSVWNNSGDAAILVEINKWSTTKVNFNK